MRTYAPLTLCLAAALAGGLALAGRLSARADGAETCIARIGGVEAGRKVAPELVVFNLTNQQMTFDLVLRDTEGEEQVNRPGEFSVGPRATVAVDLNEQLARGLGKGQKPYEGLIAAEISAPAPFGPDAAVVHVTQYFGKRKSPKAAFVLEPAYDTSDEP